MNTEELKTQGQMVSLNYLRELSGGHLGFEKEMIELFTRIVPAELSLLEAAVNRNELEGVKKIVQKMRSALYLFELYDCILILEGFERLFDIWRAEEMKEKFEKAKARLDMVVKQLDNILISEYSQV